MSAIGSLSILLVAGLGVLGVLDRLNSWVSNMVSHGKAVNFPKALPGGLVWLVAVGFAFGISFSILNVPGIWRRVMLWLTALVVVAGWAPVLSLAAHAPDIGAPWIATLWSGVCSLVYARGHRMACDGISQKTPDEAR
ncbi:MAG: hypothetical protein V4689_01275 [Verrucomicrobiota bacterium]